jgi:hypothetical protein
MTKYEGEIPSTCQICEGKIGVVFIDGYARGIGKWALMCHGCHKWYGVGLGTGKGQKYRYSGTPKKEWNKVEK